MKIYPHYPKPISTKASMITRYFKNERSWLDSLYERSYTMKMGQFKVPLIELFIPNEPELIHRIMVSEVKLFPKHRLQHKALSPVLGESIFTTNGEQWKKQRELLNPSFDMVRINHVFDLMNDAAKDMILRLESLDKNGHHDMDREMTFVTADIIFRTILSKKLSISEGKKIVEAFITFQETSANLALKDMFLIPKFLQSKKVKNSYKESGQTIRDSLASIIRPRYEAMLNNKISDEKDILSSLLNVAAQGHNRKAFSFIEILDQVAMLFLAGHETTASSMTWTLYLLALYPEYQEEAYSEVVSKCSFNEFNVENVKELTFITNIFKESLRLYPPVSFFPRETIEDTEMRKKKLKKGSIVIISPWLMHRNARFWDDPHMFNPRRFDNPEKITKHTYFPFGMGQRICIGQSFAMQESILLLATILREYRLELKPNFTPDIVGRLTTRSINGMPIKLIKRSSNK